LPLPASPDKNFRPDDPSKTARKLIPRSIACTQSAELGVKLSNLTNHFNPRDFQNYLTSDDFGAFYNGAGRKFGTRITFVKSKLWANFTYGVDP